MSAVCLSGISLGLPNDGKDIDFFDDDNFQRIFRAENCISKLSAAERQDFISQNAVQIVKTPHGKMEVPICSHEQVRFNVKVKVMSIFVRDVLLTFQDL